MPRREEDDDDGPPNNKRTRTLPAMLSAALRPRCSAFINGRERDGGGDGASTDVTLEFVILMETDGTSRQRTLFVLWSRFRENSTPRGLTDVLVGDGGLHRHDDSNGANYLATFS